MPDPNVGWYVRCYGPFKWIWGVATDGGEVIGTGISATKEAAARACWHVVEVHFIKPVTEMKGDYAALKEFLENLPEFGDVTYEPEREEADDGPGSGTPAEDVPGECLGDTDEDAGAIG